MNPEFEAAFNDRACMLTNLDGCVKCIEALNIQKHEFSLREFYVFIERITFKKTKSCIATDNGKLNNVFKVMFNQHDPDPYQFKAMINCCTRRKTIPPWVEIMIELCCLVALPLDHLKLINYPDDKIKTIQENQKSNTKITTQHVLTTLEKYFWRKRWDSDSEDDDNDDDKFDEEGNLIDLQSKSDQDIWRKLPVDKINVSLLNSVIKIGVLDCEYVTYDFFEVIHDMLEHGIMPNDFTIKMLANNDMFDHDIMTFLADHDLITNDVIHMLCRMGRIADILGLDYKITFNIDIFNMILKHSPEPEFYIEIANFRDLQKVYDDSHLNHAVIRDIRCEHNGPIIKVFSIVKFWEYLNMPPNAETFKLSCAKCLNELFNICMTKFKMLPTIEHLETIINYCQRCGNTMVEATKTNNKHQIIKEILLCKVQPDRAIFECLFNTCRFDADVLSLLVQFGLVVGFDEVKFALEKQVIIDDLGRFGVPYDSKLYYLMFVNFLKIPDNIMDKFSIDKNVLKLHQLCRNHATTYEKVKRFMQEHSVQLDRYAIDYVARANNKELLVQLAMAVKSPSPTTFLLFSRVPDTIYHHTLEFYGIDYVYMEMTYDIEL